MNKTTNHLTTILTHNMIEFSMIMMNTTYFIMQIWHRMNRRVVSHFHPSSKAAKVGLDNPTKGICRSRKILRIRRNRLIRPRRKKFSLDSLV
ncbi:uncharacterized protein BO72DRAFT_73225 [Aspergillus fijiensis CBS 313.89]|uniref:Uncharacterized protein n=1 Tax=Aspergillus fijiensis CBS 313.89 TaxID=1448319 RepID=A0A8G1RQJ7_9EURO|nr:uncharacterized protein BO72DRAFT_73225 [Aspergillus fijiensis CBS 313.89]RAK78412.1 hypothetical protein BO72DRAFT_73225 [Aspergillus fijiensis CBS 313.89]